MPEAERYRYDNAWLGQLESEEHWRLYWNQAKLFDGLIAPGHSVLEVGVGSGFMAGYLRAKGVEVTTVDIDPGKSPDVVANVVEWSPQRDYDHLLAFEVFEHIPLEEVERALAGILPRIRRGTFTSVPRCRWNLARVELRLPRRLGTHALTIQLPRRRPAARNHHWELGYRGMHLRRWLGMLSQGGRFAPTRARAMLGIHYQAMEVVAA